MIENAAESEIGPTSRMRGVHYQPGLVWGCDDHAARVWSVRSGIASLA
jgi:hypothetical protein